ncbi:MAG: ABC transporter permease [Spirochaetia bacterium]|nr:ABC transporter permease [Spirochaetia bacterium]
MLTYLFRKILSFAILFIFLIFLILLLQKSREGSAAIILGGQRSNAAEIQQLENLAGENLSGFAHFKSILIAMLHLDFGKSISGQPVPGAVFEAAQKTIALALFAGIFSLLYGVVPGVYGHYKTRFRKKLQNLNYFILATPIFIIGLLAMWIFSLFLKWFSPGGVDSAFWFVLPGLALGLKSGAQLYLFTDEFMAHELKKQYITTAIAYGYGRWKIISVYALKSMALPLLSFWLLELGSYLAGAAIVEMIFSIPGIGSLLLKALMRYDINLLIGVLVFVSVMIFIITLLHEFIDKIYAGYTGKTNEN